MYLWIRRQKKNEGEGKPFLLLFVDTFSLKEKHGSQDSLWFRLKKAINVWFDAKDAEAMKILSFKGTVESDATLSMFERNPWPSMNAGEILCLFWKRFHICIDLLHLLAGWFRQINARNGCRRWKRDGERLRCGASFYLKHKIICSQGETLKGMQNVISVRDSMAKPAIRKWLHTVTFFVHFSLSLFV